jgi:hypothetical protein
MRVPAVLSHILVFASFFCLSAFPLSVYAQGKCKTDGPVGDAYKKAYGTASKPKAGSKCIEVTASIAKCCAAGADPAACGGSLATVVESTNWSMDNPVKAGDDEKVDWSKCGPLTGVKFSGECSKTISLGALRSGARSGAVCSSLGTRCDTICASDPAEKAKCKAAKDFSDYSCEQANAKFAEYSKNDPTNYTQQPPGGQTPPGAQQPSPNNGGGGGGGGGGSGTPTQKAGGGGGNPMSALAGLAGPLMQAMMAQQQQDQQQPQTQPASTFTPETCEQRPSMSHCAAKAEDEEWKKTGTVKAEGANEENAGSNNEFNVANSDATASGYNGNGGEPKFGTPAGNSAIPNGGGQMPQGAGGGGAAAAGATTGGFGVASKAATDIMHGMMGGGGYAATNAGMQLQNGANGGGFSGYGQQGAAPFKPGMDLRQFLPGGKSDPTRKIAGGAASFQIQPQTVNIWSRISERFRARCTQGLLRDCNP